MYLSAEEIKAIQLPVRHQANRIRSRINPDEHFMCPLCDKSWFLTFDPHHGGTPSSQIDAAAFDRLFEEWKAAIIAQLTQEHTCRWPHTALQYAAHRLGACRGGRDWAGDRSIRQIWAETETGNIDYLQWLCDELRINPTVADPHTCNEAETAADNAFSRRYCRACIYYGEDMIAFRSAFTWRAVVLRLGEKYPACDFYRNTILFPTQLFKE